MPSSNSPPPRPSSAKSPSSNASAPRSRRTLLRTVGSTAALALPGCLSSGGNDPSEVSRTTTDSGPRTEATTSERGTPDPTTPTVPDGPESPPERPATLSADSAREYAKNYEFAFTYNDLYEPNADTVEASCEASVSAETDRSFYVVATCTGYADIGTVHADYGSMPVLYYLTDQRTERITAESVTRDVRRRDEMYRAADDAENLKPNRTVTRLRAYNLGDSGRTLDLTVTYLGDSGEEVAFSETYRLEPGRGTDVSRIAIRRGEYRIDATLDAGASATHHWTLSESNPFWETAFYATPDGEVLAGEWPR